MPTRRKLLPELTTPPLSDEQLMVRCRDAGDSTAFAELMHRRAPELTRYLRRFAGRSAAEDLLQATFLHAYRQRRTYSAGRPLGAWLYGIATHLAVDWLRRAAHRRTVSLDDAPPERSAGAGRRPLRDVLEAGAPPPSELAALADDLEWAEHAVAALPAKLRSVVELIYLLGLSYAETAERLKVPVGTVKSRLHHAIERLRRESGELSAAPPGKPGDVCGPGDLENRLAARRNSENQPPSRT